MALNESSSFRKIYEDIEKNPSFKGDELQGKIKGLIREKDINKAKKGVAEIIAKHFKGQMVKILRNEFAERIKSGHFKRTLIAKTQAHLTGMDVRALLSKMLNEVIRKNKIDEEHRRQEKAAHAQEQ